MVSPFMNLADWVNTFINNQYFSAIVILLAFYLISEVFLFLTEKIILALTAKTKTEFDDKLVHACKKPASKVLLMVGLKIAIYALHETPYFETILTPVNKITNALIYIFFGLMAINAVNIFIDHWGETWAKKTRSTIDDALLPLFHKTAKVIVWIVALLFILSEFNVDLKGILAGLGVAGLALGFAVKDSLANIFGGVSLLLDKALKVGDVIQLDSGEKGIVMDVGLRSTRIKTFDNVLILVPNGTLANSRIVNERLPDLKLRIVIPFGVEYGSKPSTVKRLVLKEIKAVKGVITRPAPSVRFKDMGDSALLFKAYAWIEDPTKKVDIHEKIVTNIYDILNQHRIGIPYPTRTLYMTQEKATPKKKKGK